MPYIVAEPCINCKYMDCVEVCPVDCFYEGPNFLAIQPDECIDCNACVPVCPVEAIYPEDQLPEVCFTQIPWGLTLEGQYIVKNAVLIGAALVVGGTIRNPTETEEEDPSKSRR